MKIVWTPRARRNLRDAARYLTQFNPTAALSMVSKVRAAPVRLAELPAIGRAGRIEGTRELVVSDVPYILAYCIRDNVVEILAVMHTSRQWPDEL